VSFDTLIMKAVKDQLEKEFTGSPVQKVYENDRGEIILHLYSHGRQPGLLLSANPQYARVHMTYGRFKHKEQPSPFCMLLRKYLVGGRARAFSNPALERILEIEFDPPYGMSATRLVAEIMDRRSNLILVDEKGIILGAVKTVSWDKNPKRAIQPGEPYRPVPPQVRLNPLEMSIDRFSAFFNFFLQENKPPEIALLNAVKGLSPLVAKEALYRSGWADQTSPGYAEEQLFETVKMIFLDAEAGRFEPVLITGRRLYSAIKLTHLPADEQVKYDNVSEMLDQFYGNIIMEEQEKQLKSQLKNTIDKRLKSLFKKKKQQEKELEASTKAPRHRLYGELLLAYSHEVPRGAERAVLTNFYNPEENVEIPLDPAKSVSENAQHHFNRYQKAKKGRQKIRRQLNKTRAEIEYCQNLSYSLENSDYSSLEEIRQEMIETGYLREKSKDRGKRKEPGVPQPYKFKSSAGHTILVGRNNRQNDYVTFKAAARNDTWFHARDIPGGHVVLKEAPYPPPEQDIEEAAFLAAYFSRGKDSSAVDIDYTEIRHVRRRPGGKPGFVFYENYNTVTANPSDPELRKKFAL